MGVEISVLDEDLRVNRRFKLTAKKMDRQF